jgi:CheY-like chemotaxis protein
MGMLARPALALIVAPNQNSRELMGLVVENSDYQVREVETPEAALRFLASDGLNVGVCFAEFLVAETEAGIVFAQDVWRDYPWIRVVISASELDLVRLPSNASRIDHPWHPLDIIIQAERAKSALQFGESWLSLTNVRGQLA